MVPRNLLGAPIFPQTLPGEGFTGISPKPENLKGAPWAPVWDPYSPFVGPWPIAGVGGMAAGPLYKLSQAMPCHAKRGQASTSDEIQMHVDDNY